MKTKHEYFMAILTLLFTALYSIQIIAQPSGTWQVIVFWSINVLWLGFAADYLYSLISAQEKKKWFIRHIPELIIVAVPFLRTFRLLRLLSIVIILQKMAGNNLRGKVATYVIGSTVLILYISSLAILDTERGLEGSQINNFGDALWWSITTITTVGYGDITPISIMGRFIAVFLMIGGIALLGVVTATLASWIISKVEEEDKESKEAERIVFLEGEIAEIKQMLKDIKDHQKSQ